MKLPPALRAAIERALNGRKGADLAATAAALSQRYRDQRRDGRLHVGSEADALAYLAVRLPATYAAVRTSFAAVKQARPDFAPKTALDIGAGPGTALWAAADCWPALADAVLVEASAVFQACGAELAREADLPHLTWRIADAVKNPIEEAPRDLVILSYVLNELAADARPQLLQRLWKATADTIDIIEPGTPAGWQRIVAARAQLLAAGAHPIAPCPHAHPCPLSPPDWCHFAARVARSRAHRLAKEAELAWEDEKFSYLAVSRMPAPQPVARVIARPRKGSGRVTLKLCRPDGSDGEQRVSRSDGAPY